MDDTGKVTASPSARVPSLALPDAEAARRAVGRWLRSEVGDALYPADAIFLEEGFLWHVPVWFSTAQRPMVALVADVYLNAATGAFTGRPTAEEIIRRVETIARQG